MGDLGDDTAVQGADGRYTSTLSPDWEIWGPAGGYLAAVALRAAGVHTGFPRPASLVGHFLGVATFAPVDLEVTTLRSARRAESMRVGLTQEGRPVFEALVWAVASLDGLTHDTSRPPAAPPPAEVPTARERMAAAGAEPEVEHPFWQNLEERPLDWIDDWMGRSGQPATHSCWYRFVPPPRTEDPWVDAARLAVLVDLMPWPAAVRAQSEPLGYQAPSIDLAVEFHRLRPDADWLLAHCEAASAAEGLVGGHSQVWSADGALLASGISQLLCRPVAR